MQYPLKLKFKRLAIAQQIRVMDDSGNVVLYVKQQAFKLKENVQVFADVEQSRQLYTIKADRILDFNARYTFADAQGREIGGVRRQGMKSLWKSTYDIEDDATVRMSITEENPWVKVLDQLVGEIPVVGMFTGFMFHPKYLMSRADGTAILRIKKQAALTESSFTVDKLVERLEPDEETRALLALLMMVLLERARG